ncbi:EamA family transporter RarD [Rubellimicrobium sp. CFH 75288]|uniref:EamA family transporter RarD n=1 Tax=Rubellimicrobium sp. CFH 75288 TaxID=2697034 RepID=UPI00141269C3|nr:EamA family transporter RarD [Rubellimicrobium sp. CFH 75288]NAZ38073.1 EamA family transporter RarD [Rubellimicrobium sp. CFH 75288]
MEHEGDSASGLVLAVTVYVLWGFLPLYLALLAHVPPAEVVAHRILWSLPLAALVLWATGRGAALRAAIRSPASLATAGAAALILSVNWGIYVWAVTTGHALDAALGYYINPLFSILLAALLLRERLSPLQVAAVALAALAVAYLTWDTGRLPVAALGLTVSWGLYAFIKRRLPLGANEGFLLEVLALLPFALALILWLEARGTGHFSASLPDALLLLGCGAVTAGPLLLYANAAKRLRLSTIAILQYIAPTLVAILAVFVLGEPFGRARAVAFPLIGAALALYSLSLWRGRTVRAAPPPPQPSRSA